MIVIKGYKQITVAEVVKGFNASNVIGVIKFKNCQYLYKLVELTRNKYVWANVSKPCCWNESNDSNDAVEFNSVANALEVFLDGHHQHELHCFRSDREYLEFITDRLLGGK